MRPSLFVRIVSGPILVGLVVLLCGSRVATAADSLDADQIKAVLHTTADEEGGFIDRAIVMVNRGKLPREIFDSTFLWARKKPKHKFQYFKRALISRAAEVGVQVQ